MRIALVTPNYNYADYLEVCIQSVIGQGVDGLEYHVCDAGSTDGSLDIIKKYEPHLASWRSGPDDGPYAAIHNVLMSSECDVFGWLNSDDMLLPGTLSYVAKVFEALPEVQWLSTLNPVILNRQGDLFSSKIPGISRESWLDRRHCGSGWLMGFGFLQQESTFFRRSLWRSAGGLDPAFPLAGDFDLWCRFFERADIHVTRRMLGCFRNHGANRSELMTQYKREARDAFRRSAQRTGKRPSLIKSRLLSAGMLFKTDKIRKYFVPWSYSQQLILRGGQDKGMGGFQVVNAKYF